MRARGGALRVWLAASALAAGIGAGYAVLVGGTPRIGASIGLVIGAALVGFELFVVQRPVGAALRRLPLAAFIGLATLVWLAVITATLHLVPRLFIDAKVYGEGYEATTFGQDLVFSFAVSAVINAAIRVRGLVGPRVLRNFLLGRYHRPLREDRVFLFLDLADSTALAERLGDEGAQSLIARFFFDVAQPVIEHGGETHRYIGDEVVVTWPLAEAIDDARCVRCVLAIEDYVAARAERYRRDHGVVPRFRSGMHGGSVVASEIGDDKREIVYFGDTVNTAARLGAACKRLGREFLISAELLDRMALPPEVRVERLGGIELAGKERPFEVAALAR